MTTVFSISESLFPRTISLNEIKEIKNAKKALFELFNNDDAYIKIDAFNQLKAMASPTFKDAFTYTTTAINDTAFNVNLSIGALFSAGKISTAGETINLSDHIKTFTERCFSQDEDTNYFIQLKKDIPRSTIYFYNAND